MRILVLSYYHPWIAGGGHRPHQLLLEDLRAGREVAFVFSSSTGQEDIAGCLAEEVYAGLLLYAFESPDRLIPLSERARAGGAAAFGLAELLADWRPRYARAHNPVSELRVALTACSQAGIPFVYDQMDYWEGFGVQPWGPPETELAYLEHARAIVTVSEFLARRAERTGKPVLHLANAISPTFLERLRAARSSRQRPAGPRRVLYMGAMWPDWFDWELAYQLVDAAPQLAFTFVGAVTASSDEDDGRDTTRLAARLAERSQVTLLDEVPHAELIPLLAGSDIGLIPFVVNDVTLACSPLKVFEYIGADLPVVSTHLPEIADYPLVHTGLNGPELCDVLTRLAAAPPAPAQRQAARDFSERNTWRERSLALDRLVERIL